MTDVRRILNLVDFSETSEHATDFAVGLAEVLGSELHFLHCYSLPVYPMPDGALVSTAAFATRVSAEAQKGLDDLRARFDTKVEVLDHLTEGLPHREVQRLVDELGIDLVVMGTHGRTGLNRLLVGSVAERVVRTSPVPVITIPPSTR